MKKSMQISGLLAVLLALSGGVQAAGLGKMSVRSALGQPLRAEIELLSVPAEELAMVEAKLASAEAFRQARIDRAEGLAGLHFSIDKRADGQPVVRIVSATPVNDPFVDLLIELNWSSGRVLREYTVLLDPSPQQMAKAGEPEAASVAPVAAAEPAPVAPTSSRKSVNNGGKAITGEKGSAGRYGPVKAGENLRRIAEKVAPPDVTVAMMMASLYQTNRQAFANDNMNLLKEGQLLKVPERDAIMLMVSPSQARQLIGQHAAAWHGLQGRVADQAARRMAGAAPAEGAGTGKIVVARPEDKAPAQTEQKDVLRLSKGEPAKGRQANVGSAQRLQNLEEELAAKNRALEEAQGRVGQLEATVRDLQRLVEQKGKEGEKETKPQAEAAKPAAPAEALKPAVKAPVPAPAPEEKGWFSALLDNPFYLGGLAAAAGLGLLLWVMMLGRRRRKGLSDFEQSIMSGGDQFKTSIFKTGAGAATQSGSATQSGVATDFSRLGLGSIDTHEVDPIAEAEVYMAYGRDAQAEEILKEALAKDPSRHEIAMKLLEIYASRQDTASFETQASELYASLGDSTSPIWHKAAEMGRGLDPDNPLYRLVDEPTQPPATAPTAPQPSAEAEAEAEAEVPSAEPPEAVSQEAEPVDEHVVEFDLPKSDLPDTGAATTAEEAFPPSPLQSIDFDLSKAPDTTAAFFNPVEPESETTQFPPLADIAVGDLSTAALPPLQPPEEPIADIVVEPPPLPGEAELGTDDAWASPAEFSPPPGAATVPELDLSGIDLSLLETPPSHGDELVQEAAAAQTLDFPAPTDTDLQEEVNTKLDLAKAYLEMGDKEGAREILDEILKEGDARQQEEAGKLLADLK